MKRTLFGILLIAAFLMSCKNINDDDNDNYKEKEDIYLRTVLSFSSDFKKNHNHNIYGHRCSVSSYIQDTRINVCHPYHYQLFLEDLEYPITPINSNSLSAYKADEYYSEETLSVYKDLLLPDIKLKIYQKNVDDYGHREKVFYWFNEKNNCTINYEWDTIEYELNDDGTEKRRLTIYLFFDYDNKMIIAQNHYPPYETTNPDYIRIFTPTP